MQIRAVPCRAMPFKIRSIPPRAAPIRAVPMSTGHSIGAEYPKDSELGSTTNPAFTTTHITRVPFAIGS